MSKVNAFFRNKVFWAIICILIAGVIAFVVIPRQNANTRTVATVLRVRSAVPANTEITSDLIVTKEVGVYGLPGNLITDPDQIIGQYAKVDLLPGDNLVAEKFKSTNDMTDAFLYQPLDKDRVAVTVTTKSQAASLSSKLITGDAVTVYAIGESDGRVEAYPELKYMGVVAVSNTDAQNTDSLDKNTANDGTEPDLKVTTVTLACNPDQARRLIEIENHQGGVHLAFVARGEAAKELLNSFVPPAVDWMAVDSVDQQPVDSAPPIDSEATDQPSENIDGTLYIDPKGGFVWEP